MAKVALAVTFSLTLARTGLVLDAVCSHARTGGVVGQVAQSTRRMLRSPQASHASVASPRQQSKGPAGGGAPKTRTVHALLIGMHVTALLAQGAYLLKYTLPISDALCKGAFGAALALLLCYDATLVFFLVAKTRLTNGTRKLACWETVAIWWSRIYCLAYLCPMAIFLGLTCPGVVNEEGTQCYHEVTSTNIEGYVTNNCLLTVQFVILLALFVKPLLVPQEGTQSGGALYRRVVYRNVLCTFTIVVATLITTVVTTLAFLEISPESTKPRQVADVMPALNSFVTLCLTEIALPLGFTSGWKSIFGEHRGEQRHHDQSKVDGTVHSSKKATAARSHGSALGATGTTVVPTEAQP